MDLKKLERYAKPLLRITMSLVFLYFGYQQLTDTASWIGFVPNYVLFIGISAETLVMGNALLELTLGTLLLLGLFTYITSLVLAIHLFFIAFSLGVSDLGVRDFGLTISTFVVFLNGPDNLTLDKIWRKK